MFLKKSKLLQFLILSFFASSFFLGIAINSIAYLLFSTGGMVLALTRRIKFLDYFKSKNILWPSILLFVYILILEVAINPGTAMKEILAFSPFFIIPLFIPLIHSNFRLRSKVIDVYIYTAGSTALINVFYAFYRGWWIPKKLNFWYFTYDFFSEPFSIQPIYLGLFYVFALIAVINRLNRNSWFKLCLIVLFSAMFLLAARNALVSALILVPTYFFIIRKFSLKWLLIFVLTITGIFYLSLQNPILKNRFLKVARTGNFFSGTNLRTQLWQSSIKASKNALVFGHGKHKGREVLVNEFKKSKLKIAIKYKYHSHNQVLDFILSYGLIGLSLLIFLISKLLFVFIKHKDWEALFWLFSIIFASITETLLSRQWGILYFVFFATFFYNHRLISSKHE